MNTLVFILATCMTMGAPMNTNDDIKTNASDPLDATCTKLAKQKNTYSCVFKTNDKAIKFDENKSTTRAELFVYVKTKDGELLANETMNQVFHFNKTNVVFHNRSLLDFASIVKMCSGQVRRQ